MYAEMPCRLGVDDALECALAKVAELEGDAVTNWGLSLELQRQAAELKAQLDRVRLALFSAAQGAIMDESCDQRELVVLAEEVRDTMISVCGTMGEYFDERWEVMAGPYGDNNDALPYGATELVEKIAELQAQLGRANEFTKNQTAEIDSLLTQLDRAISESARCEEHTERCEDELDWWRKSHCDDRPPADIWEGASRVRATKPRPDECYKCKVTLIDSRTPEARVPRCWECPEPESMEEVDAAGPTKPRPSLVPQNGDWAADDVFVAWLAGARGMTVDTVRQGTDILGARDLLWEGWQAGRTAQAKPRPMPEAPSNTWLLLRVSYEESSQPLDVRKGVPGREGKRVWIDESGIPGAPDSAWAEWWPLPTTAPGGSEWPEHGEGWSDEAMLAGGSGEPDA
jgi:hypothetical protein